MFRRINMPPTAVMAKPTAGERPEVGGRYELARRARDTTS
jgi:hypothetical protein